MTSIHFSEIPKQVAKRLEYAGTGKAGFSSLILVFLIFEKNYKTVLICL